MPRSYSQYCRSYLEIELPGTLFITMFKWSSKTGQDNITRNRVKGDRDSLIEVAINFNTGQNYSN